MELREQDLIQANVGRGYFDSDLSSIKPTETRDRLISYLKNIDRMYQSGVGFVLVGPPMCGKTSMTVATMKAVMSMGKRARVVTGEDIVAVAYGDNEKVDRLGDMYDIETIDFLVIDQFPPDKLKQPVETLIRKRLENNKPTWFICEKPIKDWKDNIPKGLCLSIYKKNPEIIISNPTIYSKSEVWF